MYFSIKCNTVKSFMILRGFQKIFYLKINIVIANRADLDEMPLVKSV